MKTKIKQPQPRDEVMKYHLSNRFNCGYHRSKKDYNRKDKSWKQAPSDFLFTLPNHLQMRHGKDKSSCISPNCTRITQIERIYTDFFYFNLCKSVQSVLSVFRGKSISLRLIFLT
jgi:hypothetical protein